MNRSRNAEGGLVYSTEGGRMCPGCRQPLAACTCGQRAAPAPRADGVVRVSRETQGRRGKGVTVIRGLPLEPAALAQLAQRLKTACGSGGTVKDGAIEIQGEHCERVMGLLQAQGYKPKRAGG